MRVRARVREKGRGEASEKEEERERVEKISWQRQQQHVCSAARVYINTYKRRVNRRAREASARGMEPRAYTCVRAPR